jgi:signal transduction histidine kinase
MLEETERLSRLVDNLLTLARGDSGKAQLVPKPLDIVSLVKEVIDELHILAEEKKQILSMSGGTSIPVLADPASVRQALTNVLHNAVSYTPENGRIEVLTSATDDGFAVIDIIDNGPGIPDSERTNVFERFYRLDDARSREKGGAGLGLAIARWAVEANGGSIEFRDTEGAGSCCRITLPVFRSGE